MLWRFWTAEELVSAYSNNNKGSRSNVNKHELVNGDSSLSIFNQIQGYPAPPPFINTPVAPLMKYRSMNQDYSDCTWNWSRITPTFVCLVIFNCLISSNARYARCLFIFCVIVYNLYYCCYAKTSSSVVKKTSQQIVYEKPIASSLYAILLELYKSSFHKVLQRLSFKGHHFESDMWPEKKGQLKLCLQSFQFWIRNFGPA